MRGPSPWRGDFGLVVDVVGVAGVDADVFVDVHALVDVDEVVSRQGGGARVRGGCVTARLARAGTRLSLAKGMCIYIYIYIYIYILFYSIL